MKLHYILFREILERSWRWLPLWCSLWTFHKPHLKLSQPILYEMMVCELWEDTVTSATHSALHWPWASYICGFKKIIAIIVALRCRVCLLTPRKTLNMLGNRLKAVFAFVLWEEMNPTQPQPAIRDCLQKQKVNNMKWKRRKMNFNRVQELNLRSSEAN